ncbi:MAG: hypothetical protein Q7T11_05710 [Deltaproteobacteria bacterium]|nr:hypothetical protein [Deltaproteobacteria bacterium]
MSAKKILFPFLCLLFFIPPAHAGYKGTLKKWTREAIRYRSEDLSAILKVKATLLSDSMLKAQAARNAKVYGLSPSEKEVVLEELLRKRGDAVLFFISFYSADRKYDDLSNPRSGWELRLESPSGKFAPDHFEKINKISPMETMYYPYLDLWSKGYFAWFPPEAATSSSPWVLSIRGPSARASLTWK